MKWTILTSVLVFSLAAGSVFAQASSTYKLKSYEFGGGGGSSDSTTYSLEGILGEPAGELDSSSYSVNSGLTFAQNADVPAAPTFTNDTSRRYNKLKLVLVPGDNPTDTKYTIAISSDNWVSTQYVQSDNTIGSTLGTEDLQTYSSWGGASGIYVIGLSQSTTYKVKVRATQGKFTESAYGPEASAATVGLIVAFDVDIGSSSDPGETGAPYTVALGNLTPGSVTTATNRVWMDFDTNAESGGYVYVYDTNAGLKSTALNYTISSATGDLTSASSGYGLQGASKTQTSGGPLDYVSPYDATSTTVGVVSSTIRQIFTSTAAPIVGGRGSIAIKAKSSTTTPGASDYADILTLVASAGF